MSSNESRGKLLGREVLYPKVGHIHNSATCDVLPLTVHSLHPLSAWKVRKNETRLGVKDQGSFNNEK